MNERLEPVRAWYVFPGWMVTALRVGRAAKKDPHAVFRFWSVPTGPVGMPFNDACRGASDVFRMMKDHVGIQSMQSAKFVLSNGQEVTLNREQTDESGERFVVRVGETPIALWDPTLVTDAESVEMAIYEAVTWIES